MRSGRQGKEPEGDERKALILFHTGLELVNYGIWPGLCSDPAYIMIITAGKTNNSRCAAIPM